MSEKKRDKNRISTRIGTPGIISFAEVAESSHGTQSTTSFSKTTPIYTGDNSFLSVACKKLVKKDGITKLKALTEIIAVICNESKDADNADPKVLLEFLPFFAFAFPRLVYEDSWQVREKLGVLLLGIVRRDKQSLGPFMKDSIGSWWQLIADPVDEVSKTFHQAFSEAIPIKRRPMVLFHLTPHILKHVIGCLEMTPTELKNLTQCSDEELDEKYERIVRSNIESLGKLLSSLSPAQNQQVLDGVSTSHDLLIGAERISYYQIFSSNVLLKHCKSKYSNVRRATNKCLGYFAEFVPSVLSNHLDFLNTVLLETLDEKFDGNLCEGLNTLIQIANTVSGFWSKNIHVNLFLQNFRCLLKTKSQHFFQYFLPILSCIPITKVGIYSENDPSYGQNTIRKGEKIFESIRHIMDDLIVLIDESNRLHYERDDALLCLVESVTFLVLRKSPIEIPALFLDINRIKCLLDFAIYAFSHFITVHLVKPCADVEEIPPIIVNSLVAFHKNSKSGNHINSQLWQEMLWKPLSEQVSLFIGRSYHKMTDEHLLLPVKVVSPLSYFLKVITNFSDTATLCGINLESPPSSGALFIVFHMINALIDMICIESAVNINCLHLVLHILWELICVGRACQGRVCSILLEELFRRSRTWLNLLISALDSECQENPMDLTITRRVFSALLETVGECKFHDKDDQLMIFRVIKECIFECSCLEGLHLLLASESFSFTVDEKSALAAIIDIMLLRPVSVCIPGNAKIVAGFWKKAENVTECFKLSFLVNLGRNIDLIAITCDMVNFVMETWKCEETSLFMVWLLLYIGMEMKAKPDNFGKYFTCLNVLVWEADPVFRLDKQCKRLFFQCSDKTSISVSGCLKSRSCGTWESFLCDIYPRFDQRYRQMIADEICHELNCMLESGEVPHLVLCSNVAAFIGLEDCIIPKASCLRIFALSFWETFCCSSNSGNFGLQVLQCLLAEFPECHSGDIIFGQPDLLYAIVSTLIRIIKSPLTDSTNQSLVRSILLLILQIFHEMSSDCKEIKILDVVSYLVDGMQEEFISEECIAEDIVESFLVPYSASSLFNDRNPTIELIQPFPGQSMLKNQECWYVEVISLENLSSCCGVNVKTIECSTANVLECHLENGPFDPYYSISCNSCGVNKKGNREIQVQWSKLLLNNITGKDLFETYDGFSCDQSLSYKNIVCSSNLMDWLVSQVYKIRNSIVPHCGNAGDLDRKAEWNIVFRRLKIISCVFKYITPSYVNDAKMEELICAPLRGLCILLSSEKFSYSCNALRVTALLLQLLTSSRFGLGQGLWLVFVLNNIYASPLFHVSIQELSKKAFDVRSVLLQLVEVGSILQKECIQSNFVNWLVEHKIMALMDEFSRVCGSLQNNQTIAICRSEREQKLFTTLLKNQWRTIANGRLKLETNELNNDILRWEVSGFRFIFQRYVRIIFEEKRLPISNVPFLLNRREIENIWDLMMCFHFSMLGRSREACSQLIDSIGFDSFSAALFSFVIPSLEQIPPVIPFLEADDLVFSQRLVVAKLLDVWIVSGNFCKSLMNTSGSSLNGADESTQQENAQEESARDSSFFMSVVGSFLSDALHSRLDLERVKSRSKDFILEQLIDLCDSSPEKDDDPIELPGKVVNQMNDLEKLNDASGQISSKRMSLGKKAMFRSVAQFDGFGTILVWLLTLQAIDTASFKQWEARAHCGAYLKCAGIFGRAVDYLVEASGELLKWKDIHSGFQHMAVIKSCCEGDSCWNVISTSENLSENSFGTKERLAIYALFRTISTLPALFRSYWNEDCCRVDKIRLSRFIEERVRYSLIKREIALIRVAKSLNRWDENEFDIRGNAATGEIVASFLRDESKIEIIIKIPSAYPLKNVDVESTSRIGVTDGRWRRWLLQMIQLLSMQDGSVVDAALLWKRNIEKEMEGVEPCPICYCTIHTKTLKIPTFACPTCRNKFHPVCLQTWFKTSGKSKCVLCQQPINL